jgi:imidazole glycerol phosphate synthase glutamine amidotransferase subunit
LKTLAIVDYGMGNIRSLTRALERAGASVSRVDTPEGIARADRLVIPGQGAFGQAMGALEARGLIEPLLQAIARERPVLGICLGLQILYQSSEEAPGVRGLGLIPGAVSLLPLEPGIKRPHMGWSPVEHRSDHPVLGANRSGEAFYFVHSYAATSAEGFTVAEARHGSHRFIAALAKGSLTATQFHPEKSQEAGARLLEAWLSEGASRARGGSHT